MSSLKIKSQLALPNPKVITLTSPDTGESYVVNRAQRYDHGSQYSSVENGVIEGEQILWTVGFDEVDDLGRTRPGPEWIITDSDGLKFVVLGKVDSSELLQFHRMTATAWPDRSL